MKIILSLLLLFTAGHAITKADEITYEFLLETGEKSGYCDHVFVFKKIFETVPIKVMLEFGLGYSTKYFLDHCSKVISVEFISPGWAPDWMRQCLELYREYSNWIPISYFSGYRGDYSWAQYKFFGTDGFYKAGNHFASTGQSYQEIEPSYSKELATFINNLSKYNKFDVALVDPGSVLRGEIVQLLFDKVPLIVSTDAASTHAGHDCYGFKKVKVPSHYEEIYIPYGKGIAVWVQKKAEFEKLIQELKSL